MPSPNELAGALLRLPPRQLQVLSVRLLSDKGRREAAAFWAVPIVAADVLLLRAARELEAALAGHAPAPPAPFGLEASFAAQLAAALDGTPPEPSLESLVALVTALRDQATVVSELIRAEEVRLESSPGRSLETWLRRAAVVAVIALTLFFYWRDQHQQPPPPRFEPRPPIRTR